jgi:hypothetical protein
VWLWVFFELRGLATVLKSRIQLWIFSDVGNEIPVYYTRCIEDSEKDAERKTGWLGVCWEEEGTFYSAVKKRLGKKKFKKLGKKIEESKMNRIWKGYSIG